MREILLCLLVGIAIVFLVEAWRAYRKARRVQDFFLLGGRLKLSSFVATLVSTNLSLGNFIFLCAIWGYFYGYSGMLWISVCIVLLVVGFLLFANSFRPYVEDVRNSGSIHEYLSCCYSRSADDVIGRNIRFAASTATIVCLLLALVLELHLGATLLAAFVGISDYGFAFVSLTALICFYSLFGGYRSVVFTDFLQGILLFTGLTALFVVAAILGLQWQSATDVYGGLRQVAFGAGWHNIVSISVIGLGWLLVTMDTWQRNCASRSLDTSKSGAIIGGVLMVILVIALSMIGIFDRLAVLPSLSEAQAPQHSAGFHPIADLFLLSGGTPAWTNFLWALAALGFIMAAVSTADTFLIVASHSAVSDLMIGLLKRAEFGALDDHESESFANIGRVLIVVMGLATVALWFCGSMLHLLDDPLTLFFVAYSVQFALFVPVVYSGGPRHFRPTNITDPEQFAERLRGEDRPVLDSLKDKLNLDEIRSSDAESGFSLSYGLASRLNTIVEEEWDYSEGLFASLELDDVRRRTLTDAVQRKDYLLANRTVLEEAYPKLISKIPMRSNSTHPAAVFVSVCLSIAVSLIVGLGSAIAMQRGVTGFLWLAPDQWLALSPVMTIGTGWIVFLGLRWILRRHQ